MADWEHAHLGASRVPEHLPELEIGSFFTLTLMSWRRCVGGAHRSRSSCSLYRSGAARAALLPALTPYVALGIDAAFGGPALSGATLCGAVLVTAGVGLTLVGQARSTDVAAGERMLLESAQRITRLNRDWERDGPYDDLIGSCFALVWEATKQVINPLIAGRRSR